MTAAMTKPMTEPQFNYAIALTEEVFATDPGKRLEMLLQIAGCDFHSISTWIDFLKTLKGHAAPKAAPAPAANLTPAYVPPFGHYMIDGQHVHVKKSKHGKTYVLVGGGYVGTLGYSSAAAAAIAKLDSADAAHAAVVEFAKVTGKCGVCHTKLTDPKSIAAGIGPVCAKKYGK